MKKFKIIFSCSFIIFILASSSYFLFFNNSDKEKGIQVEKEENTIKVEKNRQIIKKLYEELEKGNINNNVLDYFTDDDMINYLSGIMASDFEMIDIDKGTSDLIAIYAKEKLVARRNEIVKRLDNMQDLTKEEVANLEKELNDIILKLAKIK